MQTETLRTTTAFRGNNFMTQEFIGYRTGTLHGRTVHIELSRESPPYFSRTVGGNPNGGPLIGVTFRRPDGERLDPDPSKCCHSIEEAEEYLRELA